MIDALRCELDLVTLKTEDLPHIKRINEARMFRVPVGQSGRLEQRSVYARAVARQLEAEPYQVVHVLDPWAGEVAASKKSERGFTLLYEMATFPEAESQAWLEAHQRTIEQADRVLVASEASRVAIEAMHDLAGRVDVVRPGIDVGGYDWGGQGPHGAPRLLFFGPFTPSRDLGTLLDAIARVAKHRPIRALLAGDRSETRRAALRDEVKRRSLEAIVDVRGEPKPYRIPGIFAASDVCVAPSAGRLAAGCAELPQPLLEYLACYRPVVAADVPGVSELVRDEVEGLLYPAGSASALADAILEVLRDAVLRERITETGYRRVRDELNSGARRRHIREIYELVAPGTQTHDPWEESFENITGMIELGTGAIEILEEGEEMDSLPPAPRPDVDTAETDAPTERLGEPTRPFVPPPRRSDRSPTIPAETGMPGIGSDTNPGLLVPDTDPGRS